MRLKGKPLLQLIFLTSTLLLVMSISFFPFWRVSGLTSVDPFWSANSYWHKKIPIDAKIHPNSAQMISWLKSIPEHNDGHPYINYASWTQPLYDAYASTPKYTVYESGHNKYWYDVPIPNGAAPSSDADHLMGIIDWDKRVYYRFWNVRIEGGSWIVGSAGSWSLDGSGVTADGVWLTGASSIPTLAILIRPEEIEAGVIEHPLGCCFKYPKAARVYPPASSYDEKGSTNAYAIPFGARIQLDPNLNLDSYGLSRTAKIIAKAMQDYGIVVKEMGGAFAIYAENDQTANWSTWGMSQAESDLFEKLPTSWRVIDYTQGAEVNLVTSSTSINTTIPTALTVNSPNSGESWVRGTTYTIRWTSTGNPGAYVHVELLKSGVLVRTITTHPNDGAYNWYILSTQTLGTDYKIRVHSSSNPAITDSSNSNFAITSGSTAKLTVTSPNGGQSWKRGTKHTITWSKSGTTGSYVKIELLKSGVVNRVITSSTYNDGYYSWTIPSTQTAGTTYKIKITSTAYSSIIDSSNSNFYITT